MRELPSGLRIFIIILAGAAAILFATAVGNLGIQSLMWVIIFGILAVIADLIQVRTPSGVFVSLSFTIIMVAIAAEGPASGIVVGALAAVGADLLTRKPWVKVLFNGSQFVLMAWVTGLIMGHVWNGQWQWSQYGWEVVLAFFMSGITGMALNIALTAVPLASSENQSYFRVISEVGKTLLPVFPVQIILALTLSYAFVAGQYVGCVLILAVLGLSFHSYHMNRRMVDTARISSVVLNSISVGVITVDDLGKVKLMNQSASNMFETTEEEAKGRDFTQIFSQPYLGILKETLQNGITYKDHEVSTQEGRNYLLETVQLTEGKKRAVGAILFVQDVTERKRWEEQIRQAEKLSIVGELAAGTAHEIRNPLTAVKGFIQLLRDRLSDMGLMREKSYTDIIMDELDRINLIISEFLALAKPTQPDLRIIDMKTILDELAMLTESEALLKNITIETCIEGNPPLIVVEVDQIKQVFLNLINNAFHAMPDGGNLRIVVKNHGDNGWVQIAFSDSGVGMQPAVQSRIFEPFFTTRDTGTGLGLTVTYRIIQNHGGTIEVESAPGQGCTFIVSLPIHPTAA